MGTQRKTFEHKGNQYQIRQLEPQFFVVDWDVRGDGLYLSYDCVRADTIHEAIEIFRLREHGL